MFNADIIILLIFADDFWRFDITGRRIILLCYVLDIGGVFSVLIDSGRNL
jgi:hypothetical protein